VTPPAQTVRGLDITVKTTQRENQSFQVLSNCTGDGAHTYRVYNFKTGALVATSTAKNPTFSLGLGKYVIYLQVVGINTLARLFFNKCIKVEKAVFTEAQADRVLTLGSGNNIYDCSTWGAGEKVFVKKSSTYAGKLELQNWNSAASESHVLFDPSTKIEIRGFTNHGLNLVGTTNNIFFDACAHATEQYGLYINDNGGGTSHAIQAETPTSKLRFAGFEMRTLTYGASGLRLLGNESVTYNRANFTKYNFEMRNCRIWAGHEAFYIGYTDDSNGGNGGPPQFDGVEIYNCIVEESGRDAIQPCNIKANGVIHDIVINACATLGESVHASYVSINPGNNGIKIFNIFGRNGRGTVSQQFGVTGGVPYVWNCSFAHKNPSGSSQCFVQVGSAPDCDLNYWNWTIWTDQNDKDCFVIDSTDATQGPQNITIARIFNMTVRKGLGQSTIRVDGTQSQVGWVTTGNYAYDSSTEHSAFIDTFDDVFRQWDFASISRNGGVAVNPHIPYAQRFGSYNGGADLYDYDIEGYVTSGHSGAYSGILNTFAPLSPTRSFRVNPSIASVNSSSITVNHGRLNLYGTVHLLPLLNGSPEPTADDIITSGWDTGDMGYNSSLTLTGLSPSTDYDVYAIGTDEDGLYPSGIIKLEAITAGAAPFQINIGFVNSADQGGNPISTLYWNKVTDMQTLGEKIANMVDIANNATGIGFTLIQDASMGGAALGLSLDTGVSGDATIDGQVFGNPMNDDSAFTGTTRTILDDWFKLTGLPAGYNYEIMGSGYRNSGSNRTMRMKIKDTVSPAQTFGSQDYSALTNSTFANRFTQANVLRDSNGEIIVQCGGLTNQNGHLQWLRIKATPV
jgi:hypothetical protein